MSNEPQHFEIVEIHSSPQPAGNPKIIFLKPIVIPLLETFAEVQIQI